ncbi:MAG: aminotransferase class I/II-fold pyridoxal phosphate-dependent enzyme [Oscillospiraceae bacterium]|nr:aminotransferase class I/II-fold pyridoxal phosphate-dependent enzyme [Oscillospiraceae bacterium]
MNYDKLLSSKATALKPSGIRRFFDIAASMEGVISLGVGEPDFATPWVVRQCAISTLENKRTSYTSNPGLLTLRQEISKYIEKTTGNTYCPEEEIIVTVGGSEAIDLAIRSIIEPGDEVLIVEPCFVSYAPIVELTGGKAVPIETKEEDNFKLTADALQEKITDRTKLLVFPFPNNPTGAIMTREDMEPIVEVLKKTNIAVISDEIYAELTYGTKHCSISSLEGMRERTILINGFSKSYAMTGWRLGYVCAPAEITKQMLKIHQYAIMCSPTVSQYAAIEALRSCDNEVKKMCNEYNMRRQLVVSSFRKMGLSCFEPQGAFYVFPSIKSTGLSSEEFCERLLMEKHVAVVPGDAFGESGEGFIRVSYAYSVKHLTEALSRIDDFLKTL